MKEHEKIYSTVTAAEYLCVKAVTIKHHIYNAKDLTADGMIGGGLFFYQSTLDEFNKRRRPGGRPPADTKAAIKKAKADGDTIKAARLRARMDFEKLSAV